MSDSSVSPRPAFPVLIHPDLYRRLRESGRSALGGVWKALRRLRDGHWGGGTRVKRLRGVGRPVYEARTDSGGRLLFTMARSPLCGVGGCRTACHLQVWDWVEHDDAERAARRNRSPEAEFLELEAVEQFEIDEPPPHPEATFAEVAAGGDDSEPLLCFLLPPDELEVRSEEPPGVRWYLLEPGVLAEEEEFQRLFDRGGDELELKLTREQYEIVQTPGPILLAGSAGSGKTTVSVHRLAAAVSSGSQSALYLSYSPALVDHARQLVSDLVAARGVDPDAPGVTGVRKPDFFTFTDLYASLVSRSPAGRCERLMSEAVFREWFRKAGRPLDPALVWEELRSILKGACLDTTRPMLDEAAYQELGRKRAPLFVDERPEIYRIAQRYQVWLAEEGRVDRIDLCRRALAELRRGSRGRGRTWDVVVCDEVQDLTELEVAFVLALSRRPDLSGVLLTGDTQQTVQPSGFRWAEVRRLAGKAAERADRGEHRGEHRGDSRRREAPAVLRLRRNLRSVRPLVELANALLLLRRDVYGRSEEDEPEEATIGGPVPIEVPGAEEDVLAAIEGFGPRCAVLTLDEAEAERLRQRLGTSRVFHVRDAKGLEFDDVVLWKLLAPDRDLVERFARVDHAGRRPSEARLDREPRFKRLLQHLYVAATRARRHLAIHEGPEPHPFWRQERFRGLLEPEAVESLAHLFRPTASPAEWEAEGDWFLLRRRFRQAAECYRRAGRAEKETEALALADEEREDWTGALARWSGLRAASRQAPLLERLGRTAEAAARYREAGLEADARRCEARLLEERKAWRDAAAAWEALGGHADAARCWERAGDARRANLASARAAEEEGELGRAGAFWQEAGDLDAAARCFQAAGEPAKAAMVLARQLEAAGHLRRAAAAWRVAGRPRSAWACRADALEIAGRAGHAAVYREKLGETERAAELYAEAERWMDVARLEETQPAHRRRFLPRLRSIIEAGGLENLDEADRLLQARRQALHRRLPAIPWFLLTEGERLVWEELRDLERLEHRCRALRAETERAWSRAARHWDRAEEPGRAAEARVGRRPRTVHLRRQETASPAPAGPESHPSRETLRLMVQGKVAPAEVRDAVRHLLQGCPGCAREVERARQTEDVVPTSYDDAIQRLRRKIADGGLEALRGPEPARALYAELLTHEAVEGLAQVHSTRRYASLALCELLLQKSRELGISDPLRARKAAEIAVRVAEQLDMDLYGAPVVQDLRAVAWAYLAESRRVQAEVGLAESSMEKAELLLEDGSGDPLTRAELLTLKASLAGYCGRFEEALGLLNQAAAIYRHLGERHFLGRTLLKKGTILGNAGQHAAALRLIRRSIDLIDPTREPRLIVCATHNLIWFLHESGQDGEVTACLDGARRLYEKAGDRRHLNRLRWLEGKLAAGTRAGTREAEGALLAAREGLAKEGLAYEAALAAMDLAVLYVQERRPADMRRLADQIYPLFRSDDMYQETTTALLSFQQPAGSEDVARLLDELSGWVSRTRSEKNPPALVLPE